MKQECPATIEEASGSKGWKKKGRFSSRIRRVLPLLCQTNLELGEKGSSGSRVRDLDVVGSSTGLEGEFASG